MTLSKIALSFITFFLITCLFLNNPCKALDTSDIPFMDLEGSVNELRSLVNKNSPGIVFVTVYDDTGALRSSGSGFFIDNKGGIITNASIWKDAYSAEVLSDFNSYREVELLNRNEEIDIALIKVKAINETPLKLDFNYKTSLGERVIIIGKLEGHVNTVSEGLISSFLQTEENLKFIEIQTVVSILPYQRSKDGPVMNTAGNVVGVSRNAIFSGTWRGFKNDQLNAVSLQFIQPLLSDSGNIEHLHSARSKLWLKWLVSYLKTNVLEGFVYLYNIGSTKIITFLLGIILIIYIIKYLYARYRKFKYIR